MFKRKTCKNCDEKIKDSYNFCPYCGVQLKEASNDWGMLGKKDNKASQPEMPKLFNGISGGIMNKMLGSAVKMLEKELTKNPNFKNQPMPKTKIKFMFNGKELTPEIKQEQNEAKKNTKILPINFSDENLKKWTQLEKEEPASKLRRIDDKIQYELEVPGVNSIKDISIIKLEKSIEVKALSKEKAYLKTIPINLPLKKYSLLSGKLTLELDASI